MNRRLLALGVMALLVALPAAAAQATPGLTLTRHDVTVVETAQGLDVRERVSAETEPATFEGNLTLRVPREAQGFAASLTTEAGRHVEVPADRLVVEEPAHAADEPFLRLRVDDLLEPEETVFALEVDYRLPGLTTLSKTLHDPAGLLFVVLAPREGSEAVVIGLGPLVPIGDGRWHVSVSDAPAGTGVHVGFQPVAARAAVEDMTAYVWAAAGLLLGLFIMYVLVKQGWVHISRPRRFEKGGAMESRHILEARRRTLMAALKELETAHEAKEIPDEAYAPLKEEYKAQAVRVLRSLEGKKEPGQG